jgi:small GTP-binding protein
LILALGEAWRGLLAETRLVATDVRAALVRAGGSEADEKKLADSAAQLDDLFLIVVVGEWNAGKSALLNALLGAEILEEGVTPTTSRITLVRHGDAAGRQAVGGGYDVVTAPLEALRDTSFVDTPGTNAILRGHEALTRDFVPRADLVLFVTSADRPFSESERAFLEAIKDWGKKVVVVVNKIDVLETEADVSRVIEYVAEQSRALVGAAPRVFPVRARQALRARLADDPARLQQSGLLALEEHLLRSLDGGERFRLKLGNPLGVAARLLPGPLARVEQNIAALREDEVTVERILGEIEEGRRMRADHARLRLSDVDKALLEFESRGLAWLDRTLRLGNVLKLRDPHRLRADYEAEVVRDLAPTVERRVEELTSWLAESARGQWEAVAARLARREAPLGGIPAGLDEERRRRLEALRAEARRAVSSYDAPAESARLAASVRDAVKQLAVLQAGAVGLGAAVSILASTTVVDVSGLLAAGLLSALGLLVLPARRGRARAELQAKTTALRRRLDQALGSEVDREIEGQTRRLGEALAPFAAGVRAERGRLAALRDELRRLTDAVDRLRERVSRS